MFEGVQKPFEFQPPSGGNRISQLVAMDDKGFSRNVSFTPIRFRFRTTEVNFEFGKAEIRASEERKLHAVVEGTEKALSTLGKQIRFKLFVAGYTDTVGSRIQFRAFQEARRRDRVLAEGAWGQASRVFARFGETVLAVETPDNTRRKEPSHHIRDIGPGPHGKDFQGEADWSCH